MTNANTNTGCSRQQVFTVIGGVGALALDRPVLASNAAAEPNPDEETRKLTASDAESFDLFGSSVAIDGGTAVVGARFDTNEGGTFAGAAYVFVRRKREWIETQKLIASDAAANDFFGSSVAIDGDTILVGAPGDDNKGGADAGAVYLFGSGGEDDEDEEDEKDEADDDERSAKWIQVQKLTAADGIAGDQFGFSVVIERDTLLVGTPGDDNEDGADAGAAYVFDITSDNAEDEDDDKENDSDDGNGNRWMQVQKLTASDGTAGDQFGFSAAVGDDTALVSAPNDDSKGGTDAGAAYLFRVKERDDEQDEDEGDESR